MSTDDSNSNYKQPENSKPKRFTAGLLKDAKDAVIREMHIPDSLKDKLKKPNEKRGR